jgi:hypothetical protein
MIQDFTRSQLEELSLEKDRPLVICDVDEVVVHFTRAFEGYLAERALYLDTSSFALSGNIRKNESDAPLPQDEIMHLIDGFFAERTAELDAIEGAVDSLLALAEAANIVMLTNLPHHAREKRIANLRKHGLDFPCITNNGPKGPAISHLAAERDLPVVFIDDSPNFIASSHQHAPAVHLVHFLHDERFARHHTPFPFVSLTTGSWRAALPHIQKLIG